eukprot:jgi/Phyca11/13323/fgenesh1_pg.PHYCAscaffold_3_\
MGHSGNNAEDGERATTVRIGGAGADGELVLQVATVASATEDVTKELEAASKTVATVASATEDVTKELEAMSKTVSALLRGRDQGAGGGVEDGERATTVRMGGAGADGELVLQVATVASATEDVTKELEAASKTVSALLRGRDQGAGGGVEDGERATTVRMGGAGADGELVLQVATEDVTKAPETTSKTSVLNVAVADVDLVLVIVAVVSMIVVYVVAVSADEVLVVVVSVELVSVDMVDVVSVELLSKRVA